MRICLFTFLLTASFFVKAQNVKPPFSVRYLTGYLEKGDLLQIKKFLQKHPYHPMPNYELTIMDTFAYVHSYWKERERNIRPLGSTFKSNNLFIDFNTQKQFRQVNLLYEGKYIVESFFGSERYNLFNDSMVILGYTCFRATPVIQPEYVHNTYWYAPSLRYSVSVHGFIGLPGLVLAIESRTAINRLVIIAERIDPETRKFHKNKKGKLISEQTYTEMLRTMREKFQ